MVIVERDRELAQLKLLLADCRRGNGAVAVVNGAVASGKTELLHVFAQNAIGSGALCFTAHGSNDESDTPLGLARRLVHGLVLYARDTGFGWRIPQGDDIENALLGGRSEPLGQEMTRWLRMILLALAERGPVVLGIDDAHRVGRASLQCLLRLARELGSARVLTVFTEPDFAQETHAMFRAELSHLPGSQMIRLAHLSDQGVAEILAWQLGMPAARKLAPACHEITGGNPLLVGALLEDQRAEPHGRRRHRPDRLTVGPAFTRAVQECVWRGDEAMREVAHGAAILGDSASWPLMSELLDGDWARLQQTVQSLNQTGLLDGVHIRHPWTRDALLDGMEPENRSELHLRAARLLYGSGADAAVVARQVAAASQGLTLSHLSRRSA